MFMLDQGCFKIRPSLCLLRRTPYQIEVVSNANALEILAKSYCGESLLEIQREDHQHES